MSRKRGTRWQGDVRDGAQRYRPVFNTKTDADAWEVLARKAIQDGTPIPDATDKQIGTSLSQFLEESKNFLWGGDKAETTSVRNARFAVQCFGKRKLISDIDTANMLQYVEYLKDIGNANSTVNKKAYALTKLLKHARKKGIITLVPEFTRLKEPEGRIRFLTEGEERQLLCRLDHHGYQEYFNFSKFLLYTGCRPSEALKLTWKDFSDGNWRGGDHQKVSADVDTVTFWETKGGKPRTIPLAKKAIEARQWAEGQKSNASQKVWHMINYWTYGDVYRRARDLVGLDDTVIPYTLRHTCASRLVQRGIDIRRVRDWMGHSSITVTMRYAHLAPTDLNEAASVL